MILTNLKHFCLRFLHVTDRLLARALIWLLIQIRPLLGPASVCPFPIGCTQYCIQKLESCSVPVATWHTCIRLLRCNPIGILVGKFM